MHISNLRRKFTGKNRRAALVLKTLRSRGYLMVSITLIKNLYDKRFVSAYIRHILADTSISSSASYDGTQAGLAPAYHFTRK